MKNLDDEVLDLPAIATVRHWQAGRNKNLNRGFRKLAPVKCVSLSFGPGETKEKHMVSLDKNFTG